jgi:WhiB family redox-sensing transcriptional regulator
MTALAWPDEDEIEEPDEPVEESTVPDDLPHLSWEEGRWRLDGACVGEDARLFFPPAGERPEARLDREACARTICRTCPVFGECRTWARTHREYGFWGGESEEDRAARGYGPDMPIGNTAKLARLAANGMIAR